MKNLIPHKMIIEFEDGKFKNGLFLYRLKIDGEMQRGYRSIAIKNIGFSKPHMNAILQKIKNHVKKIEKIEDGENGKDFKEHIK